MFEDSLQLSHRLTPTATAITASSLGGREESIPSHCGAIYSALTRDVFPYIVMIGTNIAYINGSTGHCSGVILFGKRDFKMKTRTYNLIELLITRIGFVITAGSLIAIQFSNSHLIL